MIKKCILLEQKLSYYILWGNLVPKKSFYSNLRKVLSDQEWNILRKAVYKKDNYKCAICEAKDIQLEAHEIWKYDYKNSIQQLDNIVSLCHMCHLNNHLGFANIQIEENELNKEDIIEHWCRVNKEQKENFKAYEIRVFELWNLRNEIDWNIIDPYGNLILEGVNLYNLLKFLASKI